MDASDSPGIGHNRASVTDLLKDRFDRLMATVDDLAQRANMARDALAGEEGEPRRIETDEQRDPLIAIGIEAKKLSKRLDETRKATTKPLRDEVTATNKFFEAMQAKADRIAAAFERIVGEYDKQQREAEAKRAAELAREAEEDAKRKLEEAAAASHSVESDVILNQAIEAEERAKRLAAKASSVGTGPTRTNDGTISNQHPWTFTVEDWDALDTDIHLLARFITPAAKEQGIRGFIKRYTNTKPLEGRPHLPGRSYALSRVTRKQEREEKTWPKTSRPRTTPRCRFREQLSGQLDKLTALAAAAHLEGAVPFVRHAGSRQDARTSRRRSPLPLRSIAAGGQ